LDSARRWRWDERPASDARPWLARGCRISLAAIMAVVVLVTLALTAWADPLL
jgi:hypothetical protein